VVSWPSASRHSPAFDLVRAIPELPRRGNDRTAEELSFGDQRNLFSSMDHSPGFWTAEREPWAHQGVDAHTAYTTTESAPYATPCPFRARACL
jgi:hypothetical protein